MILKQKQNKQTKFKLFLENNKVYFEVFSNIFLGIAAIIVSIFTVIETKKQTDIQNMQLLPQFVLSAVNEKSGRNGEMYDDENVYIINNGGFFRDFNLEIVTVLNINKQEKETPFRRNEKRVILRGYYIGNAHNARSIISPVTVRGYENNRKFVDLNFEYREKLDSIGYYGDMYIERFAKITYTDLANNEHIEYYKFYKGISSSLSNKKEIGEYFSDNAETGLYFYNIDFDFLYNFVSK
jgi:hypothetical protein